MTAEALAKLREEFPKAQIGKLPRVTCKACSDKNCQKHERSRCPVCNAFVSTQHIHLDYVGHAEVTDRLLNVDPGWHWEPVSFDANGLPSIAQGKGGGWVMWIRLTVAGMTRLGVGTVAGGNDIEKQLVSDALRNAAMRFEVALNLWAKTELEAPAGVDQETGEVAPKAPETPPPDDAKPNPYAKAVRTAAEQVGLDPPALAALLDGIIGSPNPEDVTRQNCAQVVGAIHGDDWNTNRIVAEGGVPA